MAVLTFRDMGKIFDEYRVFWDVRTLSDLMCCAKAAFL
jgi:hypothetical protein